VVVVVGYLEFDGAAGAVEMFALIVASTVPLKLVVAASIVLAALISEFWRFWG
jgi:hypothetical protein